jgi:phosphoribosylamine--glycine ligase
MAAPGYPDSPRVGDPILGTTDASQLAGVQVFHAGTKRDASGVLVTSGGRVLAVTASGDDVSVARARAYQAVAKISWNGAHFRRDIGNRRHNPHE